MATKLTAQQIKLRIRANAYEYHATHGLPERRAYWMSAAADVWAQFYAESRKEQTWASTRISQPALPMAS